MAETLQQLVELFQRQMEAQNKQLETQQQQVKELIDRLGPVLKGQAGTTVSISNFVPFDSTSELWKDYLARFYTFTSANSVPEDKVAQVFLTN